MYYLNNYSLLLFVLVQMGEKPKWTLTEIPNFDFYKSVHFLKKHWHVTENATR